jgi:lipid-A-disaccharide synthase-like uncharacterized protein
VDAQKTLIISISGKIMSAEALRIFLYPITGSIASLCFGGRFLIQWVLSEKRGQSYVPKVFWYISLLGNFSLMLHYSIQVQYPFALIQALNSIISWRNLNIMKDPSDWIPFRKVLLYLGIMFCCVTAFFILQNFFILDEQTWLRIPVMPWNTSSETHAALIWHVLGVSGALLFTSRFWLQWWQIEKHKTSYLSTSFWWISISGALLTTAYAVRISDFVMIIGYGTGIIPYIRNLMLLKKQ